MCRCRLVIDDDNADSICAARLVWLAMRDAIRAGELTDFAPDYFFGFSHALALCHVISLGEWELVKHSGGTMAV